jgi:CRISPR-associated protein Csb2
VVRRVVVLGTGVDHAVADSYISAAAPQADGLVIYEAGDSPCAGTLDSLLSRHEAMLNRLVAGVLREDLPTLRFSAGLRREHAGAQLVLAVRTPVGDGSDRPLPIAPKATAVIASGIRQHLAGVLIEALGRRRVPVGFSVDEVERLVLGRGAGPDDKIRRISIMPLPSIGHEYSDGLLRRVLVSIPPACPIPAEVIRRALSDTEFELDLPETGVDSLRLRLAGPIEFASDPDVEARETSMLKRYVGPARIWRTVSPIVLPGARTRARATDDPETKARMDEQRLMREEALFRRAMQDAGIDLTEVERVQLKREPFGGGQPRADAAWKLPRNAKGRRWLAGRPRVHAEILFTHARAGPLAVGDGRYLGLGLFHGAANQLPGYPEIARFRIGGERRPRVEDSIRVGDALRRALMSGRGRPPIEFSGHDTEGPLRADSAHGHAFFLAEDFDADGLIDHLVVSCRQGFSDDAVSRLRHLGWLRWSSSLAQKVGSQTRDLLSVELEAIGKPETLAGKCTLLGPSRVWSSLTPYLRPWHIKQRDRAAGDDALSAGQICREYSLRWPDMPPPSVERLLSLDGAGRKGHWHTLAFIRTDRDRLASPRYGGFFRLRFEHPISGPIALGHSAHFGLGLFIADLAQEQFGQLPPD